MVIITALLIAFVSSQSVAATGETVTFGNAQYMEDMGALIIITNPAAPQTNAAGLNFVTVPVTQGANTVQVTLFENPTGSGIYNGYVYFSNAHYTPPIFITPVLPISDIADQNGQPVQISATLDGLTATTQITTANFDNTGLPTQNPLNWITSGTPWAVPPKDLLPNPLTKMSCTQASADGVCGEWKISSGADNGLKIPWPGGLNGFYKWHCNPSMTDSTGGLVGGDTVNGVVHYDDPQCPSASHNDVYVQVDWLKGQKPDIGSLNAVISATAKAGITLHIQLGNEINFHKDQLSNPLDGGSGATNFDTIKRWFFGNATERTTGKDQWGGATGYQPNLTAKRQVFHYVLFLHAATGNTRSGYSELPGNDISVTLGDFTGGTGSVDEMEGTLLHELGHNLGLHHGGNVDTNCKPNYISVMNYLYQMSNPLGTRPLNYSWGFLSPLTESSMTESALTASNGHQYSIMWGYPDAINTYHIAGPALTNNGAIDWDQDVKDPVGGEETTPYSQMISKMPNTPQWLQDCTDTGGPQTTQFNDFNDTLNFVYNFRTSSGSAFSDTYSVSLPEHKTIKLINDNPSSWVINWVKEFGPTRMIRAQFEIPNEISADDIKQLHLYLISDIKFRADNKAVGAFGNDTQHKQTFDSHADKAYAMAAKNDLIGTLQALGDIKGDVKYANSDRQAELNNMIDNAIKVYQKDLMTPEVSNTLSKLGTIHTPPIAYPTSK